jgi:hypothetical protein
MQLEWATKLLNLCRRQNVKAFVKQLGKVPMDGEQLVTITDMGRKGGNQEDMPEHLRVREFPALTDALIIPNFGTFDLLADLAKSLPRAKWAQEKQLRDEFIQCRDTISKARYDVGRILAAYQSLYSEDRTWLRFLRAVNIGKSTAYDLIACFEAASGVSEEVRQEALRRGYDLAEKKHGPVLSHLRASNESVKVDGAKSVSEAVQAAIDAKRMNKAVKVKATTLDRAEQMLKFLQRHYKDVPRALAEKDFAAAFDRIESSRRKPRSARELIERVPDVKSP